MKHTGLRDWQLSSQEEMKEKISFCVWIRRRERENGYERQSYANFKKQIL